MFKVTATPLLLIWALAVVFANIASSESDQHIGVTAAGEDSDTPMAVERVGSTTVFRPAHRRLISAVDNGRNAKPDSKNQEKPRKVKGYDSIAEFVSAMLGFH